MCRRGDPLTFLSGKALAFIDAMPLTWNRTIAGVRVLVTHASPGDVMRGIYADRGADVGAILRTAMPTCSSSAIRTSRRTCRRRRARSSTRVRSRASLQARTRLFELFAEYVHKLGAKVVRDRRRDVRGLTFVPVEARAEDAAALAAFSFVRVVRGMPTIRPFRPGVVRSAASFPMKLPTQDAVDQSRRVLVLDGGLPGSVDLSRWVNLVEPPGIGAPDPMFQEHGLAVTSARLPVRT